MDLIFVHNLQNKGHCKVNSDKSQIRFTMNE